MEKAGLIMGGLAVSSGIGAFALVMSNLIVWAVVTAWVGSMFAFIGFAMIVVALSVRKVPDGAGDEAVLQPVPVRPSA